MQTKDKVIKRDTPPPAKADGFASLRNVPIWVLSYACLRTGFVNLSKALRLTNLLAGFSSAIPILHYSIIPTGGLNA